MRSIVDLVNLDPVDNSGVLRLLRRFPPALRLRSRVVVQFENLIKPVRTQFACPRSLHA